MLHFACGKSAFARTVLVFLSICLATDAFNIAQFYRSNSMSSQPLLRTPQQLSKAGLRMVELAPLDVNDPEYQQFLAGPQGKPWKGSRMSLARKGQVPLLEYSAQDVVRICLAALQNNDDPQLDVRSNAF